VAGRRKVIAGTAFKMIYIAYGFWAPFCDALSIDYAEEGGTL
jgi:hypothetical protein